MSENESNQPFDEIEIEEWDAHSCAAIKPGCNTLALSNDAGKEIDGVSLRDGLASIPGILNIKSLIIEYNSMIKDLAILEAIPALETLDLFGIQLRDLNGLVHFRHGRYLKINTDRNKCRIIKKISETKITKLSLKYGNPGDLEAIGKCLALKELTLSSCPNLQLDQWQKVPLESMSLSGGSLNVLANTFYIYTLESVLLYGCRKLERFEGDNSNVTWLVIQSCNLLDFRTIAIFSNLEVVDVTGIKNELLLSAFAGLNKLRFLDLHDCKVCIDVTDLKSLTPKLEKLSIYKIKKDKAIEFSKANPGVKVTNGTWSYENGGLVENSF